MHPHNWLHLRPSYERLFLYRLLANIQPKKLSTVRRHGCIHEIEREREKERERERWGESPIIIFYWRETEFFSSLNKILLLLPAESVLFFVNTFQVRMLKFGQANKDKEKDKKQRQLEGKWYLEGRTQRLKKVQQLSHLLLFVKLVSMTKILVVW